MTQGKALMGASSTLKSAIEVNTTCTTAWVGHLFNRGRAACATGPASRRRSPAVESMHALPAGLAGWLQEQQRRAAPEVSGCAP